MTNDPPQSISPLKISVKVVDCEFLDFWRIRATAKFLNEDYEASYLLPKDVYIFSLPSVMAKLVHEVSHQIVVTAVGQSNASNDRH